MALNRMGTAQAHPNVEGDFLYSPIVVEAGRHFNRKGRKLEKIFCTVSDSQVC
jgi:hypothetical protein